MSNSLIACPRCSCHVFAKETLCPQCGSALRANDGSFQKTAGAILMGLTLTTGVVACGDDTTSGSGGSGGAGGSSGGMGGMMAMAAYGVGPSSGGSLSAGTGGSDGGSGGSGGN